MTKKSMTAVCLVLVCGCNQGTPGGPGVHTERETQVHTTNKPVIDEARDTFSLKPPMLATSLKQGESKTAAIGIQRGSQFDGDVKISFSNLPNGVTVDPASPVLKQGDNEVNIRVSADDQASVGDFKATVRGMSSKGGPDAVNDLKISVSSK